MNEETDSYVAPAVSELGDVTAVTLGTAGFDRADDTQYFD
ncbi:lasso RiPP family leader peptide-containing protein [Streptomyces microflavus]